MSCTFFDLLSPSLLPFQQLSSFLGHLLLRKTLLLNPEKHTLQTTQTCTINQSASRLSQTLKNTSSPILLSFSVWSLMESDENISVPCSRSVSSPTVPAPSVSSFTRALLSSMSLSNEHSDGAPELFPPPNSSAGSAEGGPASSSRLKIGV